jgi:hypothetical protein
MRATNDKKEKPMKEKMREKQEGEGRQNKEGRK